MIFCNCLPVWESLSQVQVFHNDFDKKVVMKSNFINILCDKIEFCSLIMAIYMYIYLSYYTALVFWLK